jgi:hypothetical protein
MMLFTYEHSRMRRQSESGREEIISTSGRHSKKGPPGSVRRLTGSGK